MTAPAGNKTLLKEMWIGKPGAMQMFPCVDLGYTAPWSRNTITHDLASGGRATSKRAHAKRSWILKFAYRDENSAQLVRNLFLGLPYKGPYNFYDPAVRNQLSTSASSCGALLKKQPTSWSLSGGALAYYTGTVAMPLYGTGAMQWSGAGSTSKIWLGGSASSTVFTQRDCAPVLPSRGACFSFYARTLTGTANVAGDIRTEDAGGTTGIVTQAGSSTGLTSTAWTRVSTIWTGTGTPRASIIPTINCLTVAAPTILIAGAQLEYAPSLSAWTAGLGPARVSVSDDLGGDSSYFWFRDYDLALVEVL